MQQARHSTASAESAETPRIVVGIAAAEAGKWICQILAGSGSVPPDRSKAMTRLLLLPLLLVATGCSAHRAAPAAKPAAPVASAGDEVTVLELGAQPRRQLRFTPTVGQVQAVTL